MFRKDLFTLKAGLESVSKLQGVKFAYAVARNLAIITEEIAPLTKAIEPSKEFAEFNKQRLELCNEYAKKAEDGTPVIVGTDFIIEDRELFDKIVEELKSQFKEAIESRDKQINEYQEMLEEPCDINLVKISDDLLPEAINAEQIFGIMEIIDQGSDDEKGLKVVK
jgi:hypothetical protein